MVNLIVPSVALWTVRASYFYGRAVLFRVWTQTWAGVRASSMSLGTLGLSPITLNSILGAPHETGNTHFTSLNVSSTPNFYSQ